MLAAGVLTLVVPALASVFSPTSRTEHVVVDLSSSLPPLKFGRWVVVDTRSGPGVQIDFVGIERDDQRATPASPSVMSRIRAGWPAFAFGTRFELNSVLKDSANSSKLRSWLFGLPFKGATVGPRLPTQVIWSGLAINFITATVFLVGIRMSAIGLRRLVRHRRGACLACGHRLDAGVECCPECGTRSTTPRKLTA